MIKYILVFIMICLLFGELIDIVTAPDSLLFAISKFAGVGISWNEKFFQYTNFIGACFIKPETVIQFSYGTGNREAINWLYALAPASSVNVCGAVILLLSILGFVFNRHNRFAYFSFMWVTFSFIILFLLGWQSALNEMFLSTLYFGWAFFSLTFMFFESLFKRISLNSNAFKYVFYSIIIIFMAVININGIIELYKFGTEYYPV